LGEKDKYQIYPREAFGKQKLKKTKIPQVNIDNTLLSKLSNQNAQHYNFRSAFKLKNICVRYGGEMILDEVNWEVKKGEKWALSGPNGAGKTTLLSLLNGDNPQAYSNEIHLFDRKKGSGESIWDIKQKIGFMSSEMHQYLYGGDTCLGVVVSGFFDILGVERKATEAQKTLALQWMQVLGVDNLANISFKQIAAGEQRLILLARALVKNPPLLILDEPCVGLDSAQKQQFLHVIEQICHSSEKTLIYVSHYQEEIPPCVTHALRLEKGKVV